MRKIMALLLLTLPFVIIAQELGEFSVTARYQVETKPRILSYGFLDLNDPVTRLLRARGYIFDPTLIYQIDFSVAKTVFLSEEYLLRKPAYVENVFDLEREAILLNSKEFTRIPAISWKVTILDILGNEFAYIEGNGRVPKQIKWNGRGNDGSYIIPGTLYSWGIEITKKDNSKGGRGRVNQIQISGVVHDSIISMAPNLIETGTYSDKAQMVYQLVINKFKEKGIYNTITIISDDLDVSTEIADYLGERLQNVRVEAEEDPEASSVNFIFKKERE